MQPSLLSQTSGKGSTVPLQVEGVRTVLPGLTGGKASQFPPEVKPREASGNLVEAGSQSWS
jgi:hypothetical protein